MNREQAREIADQVFSEWRVRGGELREMIADALHAKYEPELEALRAQVAKREVSPSVINLPGGWAPDPKMDEWRRNAARLASIKETARRIWAAWNGVWESKDEPTILSESEFKFRSDGAVNMAEMLESAFERRYGAGGGNGNSGIWVKPGDLLDAAIKPQHGGKP